MLSLVGGGYFVVRGLAFLQRRLLWRVRRKLIISYIFIGFVPAILIVAFFLLGGVLLFSNFSAYLVQSRLRALTRARRVDRRDDRASRFSGPADGTWRRFSRAARRPWRREFPGASMAVVPMNRAVREPRGGGVHRRGVDRRR